MDLRPAAPPMAPAESSHEFAFGSGVGSAVEGGPQPIIVAEAQQKTSAARRSDFLEIVDMNVFLPTLVVVCASHRNGRAAPRSALSRSIREPRPRHIAKRENTVSCAAARCARRIARMC
jgi:hypothetical protein